MIQTDQKLQIGVWRPHNLQGCGRREDYYGNFIKGNEKID